MKVLGEKQLAGLQPDCFLYTVIDVQFPISQLLIQAGLSGKNYPQSVFDLVLTGQL